MRGVWLVITATEAVTGPVSGPISSCICRRLGSEGQSSRPKTETRTHPPCRGTAPTQHVTSCMQSCRDNASTRMFNGLDGAGCHSHQDSISQPSWRVSRETAGGPGTQSGHAVRTHLLHPPTWGPASAHPDQHSRARVEGNRVSSGKAKEEQGL